ncbi:hypothetical protein BG006_007077 [Podila minutissima]|uniref:Uncharacterized protein n=1 Tax=Podila minutissima TaxID=64525 RepID=A0A9P5SHR2_9FUNG|nr:hypothetical protein BG006_007077 [Podila minutissima]
MPVLKAQWASTLVELPTLTFHHALLPLSIFSALHGIRVSMAYRQAIEQASAQSRKDGSHKPDRVPWGQALLSVLAMSLGGGFSASILLGMPPSWLGSNVVVPTYVLSFLLIQYTALYDILQQLVPPAVLDSILLTADGSLRALSIAKLGVDGSRMRFAADSHVPGATEPWFAMLLLGMIAGSGGGMWGDLLRLKTHHWTLQTPTWTHTATWDMKAALLSAFFYASSTSPQFLALLRTVYPDSGEQVYGKGGLLETQDAKAMTMLVMCTLLLGKRAEDTVYQLTRSLQSFATSGIKKQDHELVVLKDDDEPTSSHRSSLRLRRRITKDEDEDEDTEDEPKRGTRGRKKGAKKDMSPPPSPISSTAETVARSTRIRKSTRQEL